MKQLKLCVLAAAAALCAVACATNTGTNTATGPGTTATYNANGNAGRAATPAPAPNAASPDALAAARANYKQFCVNCHKEGGEGGVTNIEGTEIKAPSFKSEHSAEHTDEQFVRKITNGDKGEGMPAFKGRLTPEQINDLVRLIRHDFQSGGATAAPANAANANAGGH